LVIGQSNPALSISTGITLGPVWSLAFDALAFEGLVLDEAFGRQPMAIGLAFGTSFLEPKEIGNLADTLLAVSHARTWL
jgi:hypothetical protein